MGKIVCVANQKGGVGKTTTAINLSACLAEKGSRVLLVDMDPQGNATSGAGINKRGLEATVYQALLGELPVVQCIFGTSTPGMSILPGNVALAGAEIELVALSRREYRLRDVLAPLRSSFDFIIIDCPPSLGLLTLNALAASDSVLVPIQCEYYALEGLSQLMSTIKRVRQLYNADMEIEGVLLTMYDGRLNLTLQVASEVKRFFPSKVFRVTVPRNVRLSEAPSHGMPISAYDRFSRGAQAYLELADEFLGNNRKWVNAI